MHETPIPLWVVALVLAVLAPFAAKLLAQAFEKHARERSRRALAHARARSFVITDPTAIDGTAKDD